MNIVILGATGKTGSILLRQALDAGHTVTALVRTPSKITLKNDKLTVIEGSATDETLLSQAMRGNSVLISSLGTQLFGSKVDPTLIADSTKAIIQAAHATGLKRFVMMSSYALLQSQLTPMAKIVMNSIMKKHIIDKTNGEAQLRASNMDWTIVYPTALNNKPKNGAVHVVSSTERLGLTSSISRANVANWLLTEASENRFIKQDVVISG